MRTHEETEVLIVGAGPGGLTAAVALARQGIAVTLVERRAELSSLPRATGVSIRSMEVLRSFGLESEIRAGGVDVEWQQWFCETLVRAGEGHGVPSGFPTRAQSALVTPAPPACVPQDHLEPVLLEHLRSLGTARIELGTDVTGVEQRSDGLRVSLGDDRAIDARYLIAADGAHSAVRRALGIEMHGPDNLLEARTVLFRAPVWDLVGDSAYVLYAIQHPDAQGIALPAGRDRWLYAAMGPVGSGVATFSEDEMTRRIPIAAGDADLDPQIERIGSFTFAAQMAESYRAGNAFLVGDAAHRATPRGGTGMNTAIHDGYDLGWKLSWVLKGWADPELLDSYERERRPLAEHNVAQSAEPPGTPREDGDLLHADIGGRIAHAWTKEAGQRVSTLDLLGPGLTLFTGPDPTAWGDALRMVRGRLPVAIRSLDVVTARALGIRGGSALLVRPDGAPAGWLAPGAASVFSLGAAIRGSIPPAGVRQAA
jgi:2-polyprenyl-6-methoxyphenol hydroxylase-like FAD-dependent oxidoreductase